MRHDTARQLLSEALALSGIVNKMFAIVNKIENPEARSLFMESVELVMAHGTDVILGIEKICPDLNPDL